jgi:hypothetical protein
MMTRNDGRITAPDVSIVAREFASDLRQCAADSEDLTAAESQQIAPKEQNVTDYYG